VTNAAEAPTADADMRFQHVTRAAAETQIDVTNDAGADFRGAITARGAHRRDAVDEFGLADRAQMRRRISMIAKFKQRSRWSALAGVLLLAVGLVTLTDAETENAGVALETC